MALAWPQAWRNKAPWGVWAVTLLSQRHRTHLLKWAVSWSCKTKGRSGGPGRSPMYWGIWPLLTFLCLSAAPSSLLCPGPVPRNADTPTSLQPPCFLCPFHHPIPTPLDSRMPKDRPASLRLISLASFVWWVYFAFAFSFLLFTGNKEGVTNPRADVRTGLTSLGEGVMPPTPASSLEAGKTRGRRALLHGAASAHPFLCLPSPARWLLHFHCSILPLHPSTPSLLSILLLHPAAPSRLARMWRRSCLLWQVASLANGNDHVLGLAVPVPRRLGHLTHLIDAVADAVDVALVAVVIWVGAKDPFWRREKHKRSTWLPPAVPRVQGGSKIAASCYILPLALGAYPSRSVPCPYLPLQLPPLPWFWDLCSSQLRAGLQAAGFWKPSRLRQMKSPC